MTFVIPLVTPFVAAAPSSYLQGKTPWHKIRSAEKIFAHMCNFTSASHRIIEKTGFVLAFFASQDDLNEALSIKCTYTEIVQNPTIPNEASPNAAPDQPLNSQVDTTLPNQNTVQPEKITKEFSFVNFNTIKPAKSPD